MGMQKKELEVKGGTPADPEDIFVESLEEPQRFQLDLEIERVQRLQTFIEMYFNSLDVDVMVVWNDAPE